MNPVAINLYRAHRAGTIRFTRDHLTIRPERTAIYRTWHNPDTNEYVVHSRPARGQ